MEVAHRIASGAVQHGYPRDRHRPVDVDASGFRAGGSSASVREVCLHCRGENRDRLVNAVSHRTPAVGSSVDRLGC